MADWAQLERELDAWSADGRTATFWWRDDDAQEPTPALIRLLDLAAEFGDAPLALAVVPAGARAELANAVAERPAVAVLQHGYAHQNHAPDGDRKIELGAHRPFPHVLGEIGTGWQRLQSLFGDRALAVMVPPWNRIDPRLVAMLPELGYRGLSTFGARRQVRAAPGLTQANTHIDVIDWHGSRDFIGEAAALAATVDHLTARRQDAADAGEPTGLLTHHLAHDGDTWRFIAALIGRTRRHPAARWLGAADIFAPVAGGGR